MTKRFLPLLLLILVLSSCTVTQRFTATTGETGSSMAEVTVDQFFLDVLNDLSDVIAREDASIMDQTILSFAESVYESENASGLQVSTDGESSYYILSFSYDSLSGLLEDLSEGQGTSLFQIGESSLSFYLDIQNYEELKAFIPVLSDPNFEVYGPEYNYGTTKEEYLEMIGFLLDDRGPEALEKSMVTILFEAPAEIKNTTNMTLESSDTASCSFPLVDLLLLNEPIAFSLAW